MRLLNPGSVLMTSRATIGEVVINMVPMATNQGFCNFIPNSSIHAEYLSTWLKFSKNRLEMVAAGSTFLEISKKTLKNIEIDLPPLPEQKKIAAVLSSVDDAIQATQAVIDQTRRVKQGLLQQLLTCGIGHTRFKQTEIGEIPEGWEFKKLTDLVNPNRPITYGIVQTGPPVVDGIPCVRVVDLVSSQPYNVVKYISYVPYIQLEGIEYEEIHRDAY